MMNQRCFIIWIPRSVNWDSLRERKRDQLQEYSQDFNCIGTTVVLTEFAVGPIVYGHREYILHTYACQFVAR